MVSDAWNFMLIMIDDLGPYIESQQVRCAGRVYFLRVQCMFHEPLDDIMLDMHHEAFIQQMIRRRFGVLTISTMANATPSLMR